jgi:hypothetical protein
MRVVAVVNRPDQTKARSPPEHLTYYRASHLLLSASIMAPPTRAGPAGQGGPKPSRTRANPPLCGSRSKQAASHIPPWTPSARSQRRARVYIDRVPKGPKRRSNFASKVKKAARWPGQISAARRLHAQGADLSIWDRIQDEGGRDIGSGRRPTTPVMLK